MELVNNTGLVAGWTLGFQPDGREIAVVAVKGTFDLPPAGQGPVHSKEQAPLTESDAFTGKPGFSAILYESDYAHRKPFCDVLVNGCAYAPSARPAERVTVGLHLGPIHKNFEVLGERLWDSTWGGIEPTTAKPFLKLPISYDCAYGGSDISDGERPETRTYADNPVG